jgi:phenylalanyl-tRNA synthetase alpha chain
MEQRIKDILNQAEAFKIEDLTALENFKLKFLVKKGLINDLFTQFRSLSGEDKKLYGQKINDLKNIIEDKYQDLATKLSQNKNITGENYRENLDGYYVNIGSRHPISLVIEEMTEIFKMQGFSVAMGPEIEDDWHNFSALNFPDHHPARDMQDTFFVDKDFALRTHTSSVQVRLMEHTKPPIRSIMPGRVYRNEAISARSNCFFHQVEGLCIDKNVSFKDLKQTLYHFVRKFFGEHTEIRFRSSYFPFTEPSAEMDIYLGTATESDKRLTKGTGWLEILGCGMVDPNVLKNCNIDPEIYTGYAFGLGVDRIAMLKYGVKDLRTFFDNDTRFLNQFSSII